MKRALIVFCFVLGFFGLTFSNGMFVVEQGGRGTGKSGIVTASVKDGSALFYNPSALSYVHNINFEATGTIIFPNLAYSSNTGAKYDSAKNVLALPSMFLTLPVNERFTFAFGLTTPFAQNISWKDNYPGRFLNSKYKVMSNALNLGFGFKVTDWLRVGMSVDYTFTELTFGNVLVSPYYDLLGGTNDLIGPMEISAISSDSMDDTGFTVGATLTPFEKWAFALTYKSGMDFEYSQVDTEFTLISETDIPNAVETFNAIFNYDYPLSTTFSTPDIYTLGVSYSPTNRWIIEFDYTLYAFSDLEAQTFAYSQVIDGSETNVREFTNPVSDDLDIFGWSLEYVATKKIKIFGGLKYGSAVIDAEQVTPLFITSEMFWISLGASYLHKGTGFEFAIFSKNYKDRTVTNQEMQININNSDTGYIESLLNSGLYDKNSLGFSITYKKRF